MAKPNFFGFLDLGPKFFLKISYCIYMYCCRIGAAKPEAYYVQTVMNNLIVYMS